MLGSRRTGGRDGGFGRLMAAMTIVVFIPSISQSALIPAVPALSATLGTSLETTAWVLTAYFIVASVGTPISGRLSVGFGRRRMLLVLLGLYATGSLLCLLSDGAAGVIAGRVLQGMVGGVFSIGFAVVGTAAPAARRRSALALLSVTVALGTAAGFLVGGLAVEHLGIDTLFWGALVLSTIASAGVALTVPHDAPPAERRVDVLGGALIVAGTTLPLVAVSQGNRWGWLDDRTLAVALAGVALLVAWVVVERRARVPMIDVAELVPRPVMLGNVATAFQGASMFGLFVLVPQLAQQDPASGAGLGLGATGAGLVLVPGAVLMLLVGPVSSRLGARVGDHMLLAAGTGLAGVGLALLALSHDSVGTVIAFSLVSCAGLGCAFPAMPAIVSAGIAQSRVAEAVAFNAMVRGIGSAVGSQASVAVLAAATLGGTGAPPDAGYVQAFLLGAVVAAVGGAVAAMIPACRGRLAPES